MAVSRYKLSKKDAADLAWDHELQEAITAGTSQSIGMGKIQAKCILRLEAALYAGRFLWILVMSLDNALVQGWKVD